MSIRHFFQYFILACGLAAPAHASWDSFEIIEWQDRDAAQLETLRKLGVTGVKVMADRDGTGIPLDQQTPVPRQAGLRWYIENIATDFYASYHRYTPGQPVNWRFLAAQRQYQVKPDDETLLFREPSLLDPSWRTRIRDRLMETVRQQNASRPLYYSLGDETGIADLSAYWDFDLSPVSVAGFQTWLHSQYASLDALNAEWGTAYTSWASVRPETTCAAFRRTDDNFAAWNDFKAWMDTSFADALRFGTDAIHQASPTALSAIEGAQLSGWGGYDYTKLAHAVDVMEIGDDLALSIVRSLNPRVIPLTTSFVATPEELHRIWSGVLQGERGLILWDEDYSIVGQDASARPRGQAYAPLFAALRGVIGRRMIDAEPIRDSVAMLYSPASFRVQWMLDHRPLGDAWMHRAADIELEDNAWRVSLREFNASLNRMGLHPRFITPEDLAKGPPPEHALILPHAIALSMAETNSIKAFASRGGRVIADTQPGQFDNHGRRQTPPTLTAAIVSPNELETALPLAPAFRVTAADDDIDIYLFHSRGRRLLALQRHAPGKTPEKVTVDLHGSRVRDIATNHDYGRADHLNLMLDPITPTFLEIGP
jgi:Beta-galactosidase